jgi:predicted amidohydrolase YtcJ
MLLALIDRDSLGTLDVGKEADITILESDPYTTSPDKFSNIKASQTWIAGKKMFG